jgi:hypothetical protein
MCNSREQRVLRFGRHTFLVLGWLGSPVTSLKCGTIRIHKLLRSRLTINANFSLAWHSNIVPNYILASIDGQPTQSDLSHKMISSAASKLGVSIGSREPF